MVEAQTRLPPALAKNPSSRIESHHRRMASGDIHSSIDHLDKGHHPPHCFVCCAWTCLGFLFFIITILFLCITYLAFLKSGMPKISVRSFNITKLQVDDGSQKMDAVIGLELLFSNKNENLKLLYGPLNVDVTSEHVLLGKTKLDGFSQGPMNDTNLDMSMTMDHTDVDKYAADELKEDIEAYEMVFDVYVAGHIGFQVGNLQMDNVPFLASCQQIKAMDVDYGRSPECDAKIFASRPSTN